VTTAKPFAAGKLAVTVDQFAAFVEETRYDAGSVCNTYEDGKFEDRQGRSWRNPGFAQTGSDFAKCLNWNDAKAYAAWLSRKTGKTYRLLSEAELEYAAARLVGGSFDWVEDCYHDSHVGAPADGAAWVSGDCKERVMKSVGGARLAWRVSTRADYRSHYDSFRVARTM